MTDRTIRAIIKTFEKVAPAQRKNYIQLVRIVIQKHTEDQCGKEQK